MFAPFVLALAALPAALAYQWDVSVGANGMLVYDPPYVNAAPGDVVAFTFHPKNHTVTQSSFDYPCSPLYGGIDSGFVPVADESGYLPTFNIQVPDTNVIWIHCEQQAPKPHCGQGMVFAINPPPEGSEKSFSNFKAKALATAGWSDSSYSDSSYGGGYGGGY